MQKCAAIIIQDRKLLVARKAGTALFISPGGKMEERETQIECLRREVHEELGVKVKEAIYFGSFTRPAAFDDGLVTVHAWLTSVEGQSTPKSEIEELRWITGADEAALGSVFADCVVPELVKQGLIDG
jgi:8-oxo-dGTP pyrophosphatase MutT (NUDIX family)